MSGGTGSQISTLFLDKRSISTLSISRFFLFFLFLSYTYVLTMSQITNTHRFGSPILHFQIACICSWHAGIIWRYLADIPRSDGVTFPAWRCHEAGGSRPLQAANSSLVHSSSTPDLLMQLISCICSFPCLPSIFRAK